MLDDSFFCPRCGQYTAHFNLLTCKLTCSQCTRSPWVGYSVYGGLRVGDLIFFKPYHSVIEMNDVEEAFLEQNKLPTTLKCGAQMAMVVITRSDSSFIVTEVHQHENQAPYFRIQEDEGAWEWSPAWIERVKHSKF